MKIYHGHASPSDRTSLAAGLVTSAIATPTAYLTVGRLDVLLLYGVALPLAAVALYTTDNVQPEE